MVRESISEKVTFEYRSQRRDVPNWEYLEEERVAALRYRVA